MRPSGDPCPSASNERRLVDRRSAAGGRRITDVPAVVDASDLRTRESQEYQRQVDYLRANGCRCTLRWDGTRTIPLNAAEALECSVNHEV